MEIRTRFWPMISNCHLISALNSPAPGRWMCSVQECARTSLLAIVSRDISHNRHRPTPSAGNYYYILMCL
ncbi:hypothetical protein J6590_063283 [Homalodisca vitripennis]|nr:hypothetical protein J6590_063283 [Homalodisca vitripennis]